ncbi:type IV toxin-antitoxin system AbiEi family antitoxin domain-containing protein [Kribbella sp. CA-293567]|uniref:type IV toxin-antitoxin system AbiEi family antitoxin domain-containing protein n=1 Tax=Kribbella sp. CA-293567 TaxID=3002436 RepID=UPI0022DD4987|nr:type IV toxin-antitoxin system AbiEi family antitoxin domain-containing protein [Kribbella sp. CA-293567]WBQ05887.1 type IV toxin-antitoxin system AbiEi family antitoxin domain-containing protein [Kribbella sp. CA-293567]
MNPQLSVMSQIRGGVFTRADARACGYPDPDIDSLLDTGGWRRIRPGTYAPQQTLTLVDDQMLHLRRLYQVLRRGESGLIASHQSAAALHGLPLWGLDLTTVHVTARHLGPSSDGIHRHIRDPLGPGITLWNNLRLVTPARAVAEVAATCPLAPAVALTEAALYAGLVTPATLKRAASQLATPTAQRAIPPHRVAPPTEHATSPTQLDALPIHLGASSDADYQSAFDSARAHQIFALACSESASVAESRLRLILTEAALPAPSSLPPPLTEEHSMDLAAALWFPDERTVVEFEPRFPFSCAESDDDYLTEAAERLFGTLTSPDPPEPLEYCFVSWQDLATPATLVGQLRATFSRAIRRTGVHRFDPARPRRKPTLQHASGYLPAATPDQPS